MTKLYTKPVLFDVDGVIADFIGKCLQYVNNRDGSDLNKSDIKGDIRNCSFWDDDCDEFVRGIGFCRNIEIIPEGLKAFEQIKNMGCRIMFVTSPFDQASTWCSDRLWWLKNNCDVDRDDVIFARDKRFIDGITIIDDLPKNVFMWERYHKRPGMLFNTPQNETTPYDYSYIFNRGSTTEDIVSFVENLLRFYSESKV